RGPGRSARRALPAHRRAARVIDTHTHVTSCRDDPDQVLVRAREAGVRRGGTIGASPEEVGGAFALAERPADAWATAGLHPHGAEEWSPAVAEEIERRARHPRCAAIGETGLDYYRDRAPREAQHAAFRGQLEIARRVGRAVVIHCREAVDDC